jgi:cell division protein FtsQ
LSKRASRRVKKSERRPSPGKSKPRRYIKRLMLTILVLIPVLIGVTVWLAFFTDVCAVNHVNVTGNRNLTKDYVRQLSEVSSYKNMVTLPVKKIAANLERDLWIRDARIGRHLPDTVNIVLDVRTPVAMLDYNGAAFLLDEQGFVFAQGAAEQLPDLIRMSYGKMPLPKVGELVKEKKIIDSVKILASMPQGLRTSLLLVNPFDKQGIVFGCRDGFAVIYGSAEESTRKNEILQVLLIDIANNARRVSYVDVTVPDAPVVKPK